MDVKVKPVKLHVMLMHVLATHAEQVVSLMDVRIRVVKQHVQ